MRPPTHPDVCALVLGAAERARIRDALRDRAGITFVERVAELRCAIARQQGPVVVLVEVTDADGRPTAPEVRALRDGYPDVPVIGYCRVATPGNAEIRNLVLAGAHELMFHGVDDAGVALRAVLRAAEYASVAETVAAALLPLFPAPAHTFVGCVIRNAAAASRVACVAGMLGVHRKTLVNLCARSRLPPPQAVIGWCRLAVVVEMLGRAPRTVEAVALEMEFASDTALRNMLKRYTGRTASEIRLQGGLSCVVGLLRRELGRAEPDAAGIGGG